MTLALALLVLTALLVCATYGVRDWDERRRRERELDQRLAARYRHPTRRKH